MDAITTHVASLSYGGGTHMSQRGCEACARLLAAGAHGGTPCPKHLAQAYAKALELIASATTRADQAEAELVSLRAARDTAEQTASREFEKRVQAELRADRAEEYVERVKPELANLRAQLATLTAQLEKPR